MHRIILCLILTFIMSACATIHDLKIVEDSTNDSFAYHLIQMYRKFAEEEARQYDWVDSQHFINKAMKLIYSKDTVLPEDPYEWKIASSYQQELSAARSELLALYEGADIRIKYPMVAAKAQFYYDCWVEQQEEDWQEDDISMCKKGFYQALEQIQENKSKTYKDKITVSLLGNEHVFFDHNKHKAKPQSIVNMVKILKTLPQDAKIEVSGYTDRTGSEEYNLKLSMMRAREVKKLLIESGIDENLISVFAFGKFDNLLSTDEGVSEPKNRRATVTIR